MEDNGSSQAAAFRTILSLGLGGWALAVSVGAAHLATEYLFPPQELMAVDAQPGELRDALASLDARAASRLPGPSAAGAAAWPRVGAARPRAGAAWPRAGATQPRAGAAWPQAADVSPRAGAPGQNAFSGGLLGEPIAIEPAEAGQDLGAAGQAPALAARAFERAGAPLAASAGPAGWGGSASSADMAPRTAAAPAGSTPFPESGALSRTPTAGSRAARPVAQLAGARLSVTAQGAAVASSAYATAPAPAAGAPAALTPFPAGLAGILNRPAAVQAHGGRVGQGSMSMEQGRGTTLSQIDPSAKGLGMTEPTEPEGELIPAGDAPALPSRHLPYIRAAAREAGIDPALLAATAARESHFGEDAYRAEPHLAQVSWSATPGAPKEKYFDGSIGPTQVLRSNFLARGIDNDQDAFDLANNYRVAAGIIRGNLEAFPGDTRKAVAAYNVGQYGARIGRVPLGNYTDTILSWRDAYAPVLRR